MAVTTESRTTKKTTIYKVEMTADADVFDIGVTNYKKIGIHAKGLGSDTLEIAGKIWDAGFNTDEPDPKQIFNSDEENPFAAPAGDVIEQIEVSTFTDLRITRSGVADGTIQIYLSFILD